MGIERKLVLEEPTRKIALAETIFHALESKGIEGWFEFALEDDRQVAVAANCLPWDYLPLPYSLDLTDEETWDSFYEDLERRGLDVLSVFFLFIGEKRESGEIFSGRFSHQAYSDKKTVEFLRVLGEKHQWEFGITGVIPDDIPDDVAQALVQTLGLEDWGI